MIATVPDNESFPTPSVFNTSMVVSAVIVMIMMVLISDSMYSHMLSIIVLQGNNTYGLRDSIAHDDFHSSPRRTTKTLYNAL